MKKVVVSDGGVWGVWVEREMVSEGERRELTWLIPNCTKTTRSVSTMGSLRSAQERTPVPPRDWLVYWKEVLVGLAGGSEDKVVGERMGAGLSSTVSLRVGTYCKGLVRS